MVKLSLKIAAIMIAATMCLCTSSCDGGVDVKAGIGALVSWLFPELAQPANFMVLLSKKGDIAKQDYVLSITQNQVAEILAKIKVAKTADDITLLGTYIDSEIPTLRPILNQYGMSKLRQFLIKLDPRLPDMIASTGPRILALLQSQKAISSDSWVEVARVEGGPTLTQEQLDAVTTMLVEQWDSSTPKSSSIGE